MKRKSLLMVLSIFSLLSVVYAKEEIPYDNKGITLIDLVAVKAINENKTLYKTTGQLKYDYEQEQIRLAQEKIEKEQENQIIIKDKVYSELICTPCQGL